jgi:hypothetical protein
MNVKCSRPPNNSDVVEFDKVTPDWMAGERRREGDGFALVSAVQSTEKSVVPFIQTEGQWQASHEI